MRGTLIISLSLSFLAIVFALQNITPIEVNLGPFEVQGSTAIVLMATFILGVVVGILATFPKRFKTFMQFRKMKKAVRTLTKEPPGPVLPATMLDAPEAEPMLPPGQDTPATPTQTP